MNTNIVKTAVALLTMCAALPLRAQQGSIPLEIMQADTSASTIGISTPSVSSAMLAQELKLANYRVFQRAGTVPGSETMAQNTALRIRASVSVHTKFGQRGGKLSIFGETAPVVTIQTTEVKVLLEVLAGSQGQIVCVAEGKGTYFGRPNGNSSFGQPSTTIVPSGETVIPIGPDASQTTGQPAGIGAVQRVPNRPYSPAVPGGSAPGQVNPNLTGVPGSLGNQNAPGIPGGLGNPNPPGVPNILVDGANIGLGAADNGFGTGSSEGQAALRTALHNAVFSLPRAALLQTLKSGATIKVLDADGPNVVLNVGSERGFHKDDVFTLQRSSRKVMDNDTGEEIAVGFHTVAVLRLTEVAEGHSEALLSSGYPLKVTGDGETERLVLLKAAQAPRTEPEQSTNPAGTPVPAVSKPAPAPVSAANSGAKSRIGSGKRVASRMSGRNGLARQ